MPDFNGSDLWADRVLDAIRHPQPKPLVILREFPVTTTEPTTHWAWIVGLSVLFTLMLIGVLVWRRGASMDKLLVMAQNRWMLILGLVAAVAQYMDKYGATPPTDWAQWKSFIWGLVIVVGAAATKSAFVGSRPESGQMPKGTEAVLTEQTPKGATAYLSTRQIQVVPLAAVGANATSTVPKPEAVVDPVAIPVASHIVADAPSPVIQPAHPLGWAYVNGQWVRK